MSIDFTLGQDLDNFRDTAKAVFEPLAKRRSKLFAGMRRGEFSDEVWSAMGAAGLHGALVPKEHGGNGAGLLSLVIGIEELGKAGFANMVSILTAMNAIAIGRCGSESLKSKYLPRLATGEAKFCYAATEEEAGFNMFNIRTYARAVDGGFVLNGHKIYTTGADVADHMLVVARTKTLDECKAMQLPKTMGLTLFIVDPKGKGVSFDKMRVHGEPGLHQFRTHLSDVEVAAEDVIGDVELGVAPLFQSVNPERALISAALLGVSEYCLDIACNFARERRVFRDVPIGQYQSVQHPLADVRLRQEAVRLATYKAAWCYDQEWEPSDAALYANTAKYLAAELGLKAVDAAIETLGGRGFDEDYHLIHLWEAVRLFKTAPISSNMILNFVAEHTLSLPRSY